MIMVSLLRGIVFYALLVAAGAGIGWLVLPWRYGTDPGSPHMMMAMAGGGVFWVFVTLVVCAITVSP